MHHLIPITTKGLSPGSAKPSIRTKHEKGGAKGRIEIDREKADHIANEKDGKNHKENGGEEVNAIGKQRKKNNGTEHNMLMKNFIGSNRDERSRL